MRMRVLVCPYMRYIALSVAVVLSLSEHAMHTHTHATHTHVCMRYIALSVALPL